MQNLKKWIMIGYLACAAVTWIFFYFLSDALWDFLGMPPFADWFLRPPQIIAFAAALVCFIILNRNEKISTFAGEVASELSKVTWPERKETVLSAGVVIVMVAICACILAVYDVLWGTIVGKIY